MYHMNFSTEKFGYMPGYCGMKPSFSRKRTPIFLASSAPPPSET